MRRILVVLTFAVVAAFCAACSSDEDSRKSRMPKRGGSNELPWNRPANWEGGLPGMGGIGNAQRY